MQLFLVEGDVESGAARRMQSTCYRSHFKASDGHYAVVKILNSLAKGIRRLDVSASQEIHVYRSLLLALDHSGSLDLKYLRLMAKLLYSWPILIVFFSPTTTYLPPMLCALFVNSSSATGFASGSCLCGDAPLYSYRRWQIGFFDALYE